MIVVWLYCVLTWGYSITTIILFSAIAYFFISYACEINCIFRFRALWALHTVNTWTSCLAEIESELELFILYFLQTFLMEWGGRHNVNLLWRTSGLAELWMQPHLALHWPNYLGQLFNLYESVSNLREKVLFFFSFCHCMWWPHTNSAATLFDRH